jgi:ribosomal protein S1
VECRVIAVDPDEQRLSLSIKALAPPPAAEEQPPADEPEAEEEQAASPPVAKKRTTPLKGGTGGAQSQGEKFGLRW